MALKSWRLISQVIAGLLALILLVLIVILGWSIFMMTPQVIALTGGADVTAEREAVLTGVYVPLLQTLVVMFFGTTFIKGLLTISDNHFRAIKGVPLEHIRLFS